MEEPKIKKKYYAYYDNLHLTVYADNLEVFNDVAVLYKEGKKVAVFKNYNCIFDGDHSI